MPSRCATWRLVTALRSRARPRSWPGTRRAAGVGGSDITDVFLRGRHPPTRRVRPGLTRNVQTNEVGRAVVLACGLGTSPIARSAAAHARARWLGGSALPLGPLRHRTGDCGRRLPSPAVRTGVVRDTTDLDAGLIDVVEQAVGRCVSDRRHHRRRRPVDAVVRLARPARTMAAPRPGDRHRRAPSRSTVDGPTPASGWSVELPAPSPAASRRLSSTRSCGSTCRLTPRTPSAPPARRRRDGHPVITAALAADGAGHRAPMPTCG